jgi:SAM-dependent methyltransferase
MRGKPDNLLDSNMYSLPLRREVSAVLHFLHARNGALRTGLDIGFTNAGVSRLLRLTGGYWMTVEPTPQRRSLVAAALGEETVLCVGAKGELPFEDKQFDAVVLAHGVLSGHAEAGAIVRECHRILRTGGLFLLTVEYRKRLGLAGALDRQRAVSGAGGCYTESEVFHLLKDGFDVLGFRSSCRFWVQLVRRWADRRRLSGIRGANNGWLRVLYGLAWLLDLPLFWTRGHQMTVYGRRKGWRGKHTRVLGSSTPVSDAILFNPRREGKHLTLQKFK